MIENWPAQGNTSNGEPAGMAPDIDTNHNGSYDPAQGDYIVTQLFYDNRKFFDFVHKCREAGINVPIIPGIKPLATLSHIKFMPKFFHVALPEALTTELIKCRSDKNVAALGTEWTAEQCKELIKSGVPSIHFYTMGKGQQTASIAKQVY